jgi:hypothetical protein
MYNLEFKLQVSTESDLTAPAKIIKELRKLLASPLSYRTIKISPNTKMQALAKKIESEFDCSTRSGVLDGCYGSRSGAQFEGLTVWMHAKEATDRYLDDEYGEQVNPWHLLNEHGKLLENVDGDAFMEMLDSSDVEYKSDNTYNYQHSNSDDAGFIFDFQFDSFQIGNKHFLAVMFHCGGDPRGNYTSKKIWQFDSEDELYSVLFPYKMLSSDNE